VIVLTVPPRPQLAAVLLRHARLGKYGSIGASRYCKHRRLHQYVGTGPGRYVNTITNPGSSFALLFRFKWGQGWFTCGRLSIGLAGRGRR